MRIMIIMFAIAFMVPYFLIITTMEKWERPGTLTLGDKSKVPGLMFRSATLGALRVAEMRWQRGRHHRLGADDASDALNGPVRLDFGGAGPEATPLVLLLGLCRLGGRTSEAASRRLLLG